MATETGNQRKEKPAVPSTGTVSLVPSSQKKRSGKSAGKKAISLSETRKYFPIVGIGASAGGLAAFEAFFSAMPTFTDSGLAFVLVQHLAPDHKSILTGLIQRYTRMKVFEVENGMEVQPNCVYIIPPGRDMAFMDGALQLLEPIAPRGQRLPIDFFFNSLAKDQEERAICIVLSGNGGDGTLGLRAIKNSGGMAMAQTPDSAEYDSMPKSAITTGLIDYELTPAEMPAQLMAYAAQAFGGATISPAKTPGREENPLKKIFYLLQSQTKHDFSEYKPSTINRRIERRMAVHQMKTLKAYADFLGQTPVEIEALFRDLLIGVTSFFRDPKAFKAVEEQIIPRLIAGKAPGAFIRIWSPGCSTGEEVYSLAILLQEYLNTLRQNYTVQIFATDIDVRAIATARAGVYPAGIATDISPKRLVRYFKVESAGSVYRIDKAIRDLVVFSEHNMIKDPPFSKLDLISCRNLMIYMSTGLQKKIIPLFHYALNPGGFLFLGTSETVGEFGDLFATLDRKAKLYQHKRNVHRSPHAAMDRFIPPILTSDRKMSPSVGRNTEVGKLSLRELTERTLLQQAAPTGALINRHGDILYLHGRTGMYLETPPGETVVNNILKMAREGLRRHLTNTLRHAVASQQLSRSKGLLVETHGGRKTINLAIRPVVTGPSTAPEEPLYLVILEEVEQLSTQQSTDSGTNLSSPEEEASVYISSLKQDLRAKEEYLQASNEELETANEELKSSNEEMQSINEELQSTNEELETTKEEVQSINEELATVNAELQAKLTDLTQTNNDMDNLLAGTGIATVFVDHQLRILRFTPTATRIINLIQDDIGRPVGHIVSNLVGYDRLLTDVQAVLDTLVAREVDVETADGKWYTMRILPYRTLSNIIEGAVINFVDITDKQIAKQKLAESKAIINVAMDTSQVGIAIVDAQSGNLRYVNDAGLLIHGGGRRKVSYGVGIDRYFADWQLLDLDGSPLKSEENPLAKAMLKGESCSHELIVRKSANDDRNVLAKAAPIKDKTGKVTAAVMIFMDITEEKHIHAALQQALNDVQTLRGIIPISTSSKDIKDADTAINKDDFRNQ